MITHIIDYLHGKINAEYLKTLSLLFADSESQKHVNLAIDLMEGKLITFDEDDVSLRIIFLYYTLSFENKDNLEEKIALCKNAISFFKKIQEKEDSDYQWIAITYLCLGQCYLMTNPVDISQAISALTNGINEREKMKIKQDDDYRWLAITYHNLGLCYFNATPAIYSQAINFYRKAIHTQENEILQKNDDDYRSLAAYYQDISKCFYNKEPADFYQAMLAVIKSSEILKENVRQKNDEDYRTLAVLYHAISNLYAKGNNIDLSQAIAAHFQELGAYEKIQQKHDDDYFWISICYFNIGQCYGDSRNFSLAIDAFMKAISIRENRQMNTDEDHQWIASCYHLISQCHYKSDSVDYHQTLAIHIQELNELNRIQNKSDEINRGIVTCYRNISSSNLKKNPPDYTRSITACNQAIELVEKTIQEKNDQDYLSIANSHLGIARVYAKMRPLHMDDEIHCFRRCIDSCMNVENTDVNFLITLKKCFSQWGSIYLEHTSEWDIFCIARYSLLEEEFDINFFHRLVYKVKQEMFSSSKQDCTYMMMSLMTLLLKIHQNGALPDSDLKRYLDVNENRNYFQKDIEQFKKHHVLKLEDLLQHNMPPLLAATRRIHDLELLRETQNAEIQETKKQIQALKSEIESKKIMTEPSSPSFSFSFFDDFSNNSHDFDMSLKRIREEEKSEDTDKPSSKKPRKDTH